MDLQSTKNPLRAGYGKLSLLSQQIWFLSQNERRKSSTIKTFVWHVLREEKFISALDAQELSIVNVLGTQRER